jgi:branched-subunit amino acid transport protein|tara:strand:- start:60 stop:374 length:315 start_codon:yes stop_codon:yes gene_type:complete
MIEWSLIIYCGLVTFLSRYLMIAILKKEMFTDRIREVLSFVPSAVFPAIIFPAIFINDYGSYIEMNDPKIFGAIVAILVGYFSKNVIATIFSGLLSYWFIIFIY